MLQLLSFACRNSSRVFKLRSVKGRAVSNFFPFSLEVQAAIVDRAMKPVSNIFKEAMVFTKLKVKLSKQPNRGVFLIRQFPLGLPAESHGLNFCVEGWTRRCICRTLPLSRRVPRQHTKATLRRLGWQV